MFDVHDARVPDLQDALRLLLAGEAHRLGDTERDMLDNLLRTERNEGVYGDATQLLVRVFQVLHHLPSTSDVDRDTADALNQLRRCRGQSLCTSTSRPPSNGVRPACRRFARRRYNGARVRSESAQRTAAG